MEKTGAHPKGNRFGLGFGVIDGFTLVVAGCSTSNPLVSQISSDFLNSRNLDSCEFSSVSGGHISYALSSGDRVSFPQLADISLDTQEDCPRINSALSAIRDAEFPMEASQPQDYALGRVLIALIQTKDVADCESGSIR